MNLTYENLTDMNFKKLTKKQKKKLLKQGYELLISRNGKPVN